MHEQFVKLGERLIEANGRAMGLVTLAQSAASTPWDSPAGTETVETVKAVQTEFNLNEVDGNLVQRSDKRFLIAATTKPEPEMRLRDFGVGDYSIVSVEEVKPGETTVLYKVHARL